MKRTAPRRRLQLTSSTLRVLVPSQLDAAQGGLSIISLNCDPTRTLVTCKTTTG